MKAERPLRVLRVHNHYLHRGGEDVSFELESRLLANHGHDVHALEFSNLDIDATSIMGRMRVAGSTVWSRDARARLAKAIKAFQPDIAHFDNTFPLVSPAAYSLCQDFGVPVVQSLRNYRLVCPSANLFRDGKVCEKCLGKTIPIHGVLHGCYRNSKGQSAVVAAMISTHQLLRTWSRQVDRFVAVSAFVRNKVVEGGIHPDLVSVKPNFVDVPSPFAEPRTTDAVYVGRLSEEKGLRTLVEAWLSVDAGTLTIVGSGPREGWIRERANGGSSIALLGEMPEIDAYRQMARARAVVVPSEWHEPFGRVVIESFAQGAPAIAAQSGGLTELVEDGRTGLLFTPGDKEDLARKVTWAIQHPTEMRQMGRNARQEYEDKYTPERNYHMLMNIYEEAIAHRTAST